MRETKNLAATEIDIEDMFWEKKFFHLGHIYGSRDPQKSYPSEISAILGPNSSGKCAYIYCVFYD